MKRIESPICDRCGKELHYDCGFLFGGELKMDFVTCFAAEFTDQKMAADLCVDCVVWLRKELGLKTPIGGHIL